jgi:hypothetical protein
MKTIGERLTALGYTSADHDANVRDALRELAVKRARIRVALDYIERFGDDPALNITKILQGVGVWSV